MSGRAFWWVVAVFCYALALPISFYLGVTLVLGHARIVPYAGVWVDRTLFIGILLGLPAVVCRVVLKVGRARGEKPSAKEGSQ